MISKLPLCVVIAAIALAFVFSPKHPEVSLGIRIYDSANDAREWVWNKFHGERLLVSPGHGSGFDDVGLKYFGRLAYSIEPAYRLIPPKQELPLTYRWGLPVIWGGFLLLLFVSLTKLMSPWWASALVAALISSSAFRFLAFGLDVYLFGFYASILALWLVVRAAEAQRTSWGLIFGVGLGVFLCNLMRSPSWTAILPIALVAILPRWFGIKAANLAAFRKNLLFAFSLVVLAISVNKVASKSGHPVWHSMHAGLMEFGGHVGPDKRIYPYFVPADQVPPGSEYRPSWNDYIEYEFAETQDPQVQRFTPAYEKILRNDYLRVLSDYPWGMARLFSRRLWNALAPDIWFWNPQHSSGPSASVWQFAFTILSVLMILAGIVGGRGKTLLLVALAGPGILPVILVYSSVFYYSMGWRVLWVLAIGATPYFLLARKETA